MQKPLFVTTPIYYVNDRPHVGHAYTSLAADVLTRFWRQRERKVFFLTGTDEHGTKIAQSAKAAGQTPQAFVDEVSAEFRKVWDGMKVEYDYFIRTTEERHVNTVKNFLSRLKKARTPDGKEAIYSGVYKGLYCTGCEKFVTEKDLENGLCIYHRIPPETVEEKNYFFRLTSYLPQVERLIYEDKIKIEPLERKKETLGLFKVGLEDFSISRERESWGVPLPFDPEQTTYVWVDALINYVTASGFSTDANNFDFWWGKGEILHLMAKDILKFHCIFWPALLLAAGVKPPDRIFVHGFFSVNGQKMSKSLGNVVDPLYLASEYGVDAARYLLLTPFGFGQDGDLRVDRFAARYNADLANDLGNLASRAIKMVEVNFGGSVPAAKSPDEAALEMANEVEKAEKKTAELFERVALTEAADEIGQLVKKANRFFDAQAPWNLAKEKKTEQLGTVLFYTLETLRHLALLYYPFMPEKSQKLLAYLGENVEKDPEALGRFQWGRLKPGSKVSHPEPLFPRLEKDKTSSEAPEAGVALQEDGLVTIQDFARLKLRVAVVEQAERVEKSDKLLRLQVNLGGESRQIVAGIAQHYQPESLVGKKIVMVANLKPATIFGVESRGMLLAAKKEGKLVIVTPDGDISAGAEIS
ncbi:MAG: methionine--tRNA ligase [candidate division Zixibacteria bacterium]|nr:methionine--tRNA ligase [candidate division Zixibacteria bacterium]